jgi:TonB family protein
MNMTPDVAANVSLADFSRDHQPAGVAASSRLIAGLLTSAIFALLTFLTTHQTIWMTPSHKEPTEIVTRLLPDASIRKLSLVPPPFLTHLIRPRAEAVAPPALAVAIAAPPAPLLPSAATFSPLTSGVPDGTNGKGGSANGTSGNGAASSACYDAAWAQAVTNQIAKFFYYPTNARVNHWTGVAFVRLIVRRNGRLDLLEINKSSGDTSLDRAAINIVRKAQPLPAIPDRMHTDRIDAEIPIDFGTSGQFKASEGRCDN